MKTKELTPAQYQAAFRTDRQCERYIFEQKYPNGFSCRKCKHDQYYEIEKYGLMYACKKCRHQESAKAGTIFDHSKIPLRKWFAAILEITICKGGIAASTLQRKLGFGSYRTAWAMLHKLRNAMEQRDTGYQLSGLIELDGVNLGRKKKDGTKNTFYLGVEERSIEGQKRRAGFAKMQMVDRHGKKESQSFVEDHVKPKTVVKTDGGTDFKHGLIDLDIEQKSEVMDALPHRLEKHLPWVAKLTYNIKASFIGMHRGVSAKHVSRYVADQLYRFNRRFWPNQLQTRTINACLLANPLRIAELCA